MSPIHARAVAFLLTLSTGRVSPQFHVVFDPSFTTINDSDGNLVTPSYWKAMCGFIKGNKSVFVHSDQHDTSSKYIPLSDQDLTACENYPEPEEQA